MSLRDHMISDLKVSDMLIFLALHRSGGVTRAARELEVSPSAVSKSLRRLEERLEAQLVSRGPTGVVFLDAGLRLVEHFGRIVGELRAIQPDSERDGRVLSIAGPSLMHGYFFARLTARVSRFRLRAIELIPAAVRAGVNSGLFDVALFGGDVVLPPTWEQRRVGTLENGLLASPRLARELGEPPVAPEAVARIPFICPAYTADGKFVLQNDDCPIPREIRVVGHEVSTMSVALAMAENCDQLVFGPLVGAVNHLASDRLVHVKVEGWRVQQPLTLCFNAERLTAPDERALTAAFSDSYAELEEILRAHAERSRTKWTSAA